VRRRNMRSQRRGGGGSGGSGGSGGGSAPGRAWDLIRDHKLLGVREIRPLERPDRTPEGVDLGAGWIHGRPGALVLSRNPNAGIELIGWAVIALELARQEGPIVETLIAAPLISPSLRRAVDWLSEYGMSVRLASVPALAERPSELVSCEPAGELGVLFPSGDGVSDGIFERVLRVVEGAAAVTSAGALRVVDRAHILYMRGARILRVSPEPEGAAVDFLAPERKQVHVNDANFSRWGPDLFEEIVKLAQDPRLLESVASSRDAQVQEAVDSIQAYLVARYLPWNSEGLDPIDWIGVDSESRPVLGVIRSPFRVSDVPSLVAAAFRLETEREVWAPGSTGGTRVLLTGELEAGARELLEGLDLEIEAREGSATEGAQAERRGRRRGRRRRRGRFSDDVAGASEVSELEGADAAESSAPDDDVPEDEGEPRRALAPTPPRRSRTRSGRDRDRDRNRDADAAELGDEALLEEERDERASPVSVESAEVALGCELGDAEGRGADFDPVLDDSALDEAAAIYGVVEAVAEAASGDIEDEPELEIADALEEIEEVVAATEEPAPPARRRRRPKAAIAVRNDLDSVVTAMVLARERRNVPFFYVCAQHGLMDFLRGKATDIDENTDLLLVGFTAQPVPAETIAAAAVYSGQISWFDHHEWPIEDLERLREAIGEDAVYGVDGTLSPLAAVMEIAERRSRFTDKLLDFSGRRLSEADMGKWGYNLVGLIRRMCATPGDYRADLQPILAGRPADLPPVEDVYAAENEWLSSHEPRLVCFGEYQMAVSHVPESLDTGEMGRRLRHATGARISLVSREGDSVVLIGYNEEKRHINVLSLLEQLDGKIPWLHARPVGDRAGRVEVDDLAQHPERIDALIGEIVRHKSVLYG